MSESPIEAPPTVDVWASDQGSTWWFRPASDKGVSYCSEHLGTLSPAQRQGDTFIVTTDMVIAIIQHMAVEGIFVKEVLH